jgi:6-phosphogluconate dehydrogenase
MVGLGRMGTGMVRRLLAAGHDCVVHDLDPHAVAALESEGATGAGDLDALCAALAPPRAVWLMLPAAVVGAVVDTLATRLESGDTVIDGGNSYFVDDLARGSRLVERGVHYVDVGVSGGVHGLERGFCLMVGGDAGAVERLEPVLSALAPGLDAAPRGAGRTGAPVAGEEGWLHCGPVGAGHFVKMVHNGVEYGLMAAYAEGLAILREAGIGRSERVADAETAPLHAPERYRYDIDVAAVAELWRRGSVVSSWLLDLIAGALADDPSLDAFTGSVADSGEGRWTIHTAVDEGVPAPVLTAALYSRFASRGRDDFSNRLLSAMRAQFGGHVEVRGTARGEH